MELIKIGKYIAGKRKNLGMTQRQLAEQLGMSDKSVSKWERGVCLPDVSLYSELCRILGISINEFLAGEDIVQENIARKSEENLIGIAADSGKKQRRLKAVIYALTAVAIFAVLGMVAALYCARRPQNMIMPVSENSAEMQTVRLLTGSDSTSMYRFTTNKDYERLYLYVSEYQSGKLVKKERAELAFDGIPSPGSGEIVIAPDMAHAVIRVIIATEDGSRFSAEYPILEQAGDKTGYGTSQSRTEETTKILYGSEQPLAGIFYDKDELYRVDPYDILAGKTEMLAENDYTYFFSYKFCRG